MGRQLQRIRKIPHLKIPSFYELMRFPLSKIACFKDFPVLEVPRFKDSQFKDSPG